ncbi:uncharacterized protein LOC106157165 [Lingula anatina]|uniref:Uncharacterized protein LOC106157165 n=1 Tax=Lingula anatina TaxID=7574 RepID=A0A1S3HQ34_LINAN|nr:uncharacterized protein LOC106157165 [Lingula anatina]|eukprot:XP_013388145.1 uncharacterized protein LOC106157165 [Lingula anatina]
MAQSAITSFLTGTRERTGIDIQDGGIYDDDDQSSPVQPPGKRGRPNTPENRTVSSDAFSNDPDPNLLNFLSQFESRMKDMLTDFEKHLDEKMKSVDVKIRAAINEAITSKIAPIKSELAEINAELQDELSLLRAENLKIKEDLNQVTLLANQNSQYSRRLQLRFSGVPLSEMEKKEPFNVKHCISSLVKTLSDTPIHPKLVSDDIETAHRLPQHKRADQSQIIIRLKSKAVRDDFIGNRFLLKGTGIRVYEDLSPMNRGLLRRLTDHGSISNCWSDRGKILGKTKNGVIRVFQVTDDIDNIITDMENAPAKPPVIRKPRKQVV